MRFTKEHHEVMVSMERRITQLESEVKPINEVQLVYKPFEGLANEHTVRVSISVVVKLLMEHLGLQIRYIREGYTLEERK